MTSLNEISTKYLGKEVVERIEPEINDLVEMLEADKQHDPSARYILELIEGNRIESEDDFLQLSHMIEDYKARAIVGRALTYKFEEPVSTVEELFGDPKKYRGRLVIVKDGQRLEINEAQDIIGPVSETDDPLPGHPEYEGPDAPAPIKYSQDPELKVGQYIPYEERKLKEQDKRMDAYLAQKKAALEKQAQTLTAEVRKPGPGIRGLEYAAFPESEPPLETVTVHLDGLGSLAYEPESVIKTKYSLNLVFNPSRSKPSFIPAAGNCFELEWRNNTVYVMYVGTRFEFNNRIFLCFGIIPRMPDSRKSTEFEPGEDTAGESSSMDFEEALREISEL